MAGALPGELRARDARLAQLVVPRRPLVDHLRRRLRMKLGAQVRPEGERRRSDVVARKGLSAGRYPKHLVVVVKPWTRLQPVGLAADAQPSDLGTVERVDASAEDG